MFRRIFRFFGIDFYKRPKRERGGKNALGGDKQKTFDI